MTTLAVRTARTHVRAGLAGASVAPAACGGRGSAEAPPTAALPPAAGAGATDAFAPAAPALRKVMGALRGRGAAVLDGGTVPGDHGLAPAGATPLRAVESLLGAGPDEG